MKYTPTHSELLDYRTSQTFRWFEDRSENLPICVYKDLTSLKLELDIYLNAHKCNFSKNLSKSEKLEAMAIIRNFLSKKL